MLTSKKKIIMILAAIVLPCVTSSGVLAWGPEREWYTNESPADHAVFNSITNNAAVGAEADFVRIVEIGAEDKTYVNEIKVQPGKEYEVWVYYHNNASSTYNTEEYNRQGVAREVKMATQFPASLVAGKKEAISATITWKNYDLTDGVPGAVWDEAYITADEDVDITYKTASAKIYNDWGVNGSVLSTDLFSSRGTYLGLNELNGIILGCDEYSGQVVYTIMVSSVEVPVPPEELPKTGPVEIIMATVIVLGIGGVSFYLYKTKRTLKQVTSSVAGDDLTESKDDDSANDKE